MGVDSYAHRAPILILLHVQLLLLLIIMKVSVNMLFKNWYLMKVEKISSLAHITGSWYRPLSGSFQN